MGDVMALHVFVMRELGHAPSPLRDAGALEAAVMRPQMAEHYEGADLVRQCALLAIGISQAQAFIDGNKRTAFAAMRAFTGANGLLIRGDPIELARQLEAFAERTDSLAEATSRFEAWLREHVGPMEGYP
jgi:death-on-curing protein